MSKSNLEITTVRHQLILFFQKNKSGELTAEQENLMSVSLEKISNEVYAEIEHPAEKSDVSSPDLSITNQK